MEIKANDRKVINTQPLDYLFTQGEAGVDRVSIVLPLQYGQTDLSTLGWSIQLVSERDTFISKPLTAQVDEDNLTVSGMWMKTAPRFREGQADHCWNQYRRRRSD